MNIRYRAPIAVFLNVTNRCNLHCHYCSVNAGPSQRDELSRNEMRDLVRSLIECNVFRVIVTGGEPFRRPDIMDILRTLRRSRRIVQINTNGTLLSKNVCRQLRELAIDQISVSVDGPTSEIHDAVRGRGSFARAVTGIRNLVEAQIQPNILATLTRHNVGCLPQLAELCRAIGARGLSVNHLSPLGRGAATYDTLRPTPEEWHIAVRTIRRLQENDGGFVRTSFSYWEGYPSKLKSVSQPEDGDLCRALPRLLPCDAGKTFCAICADGWVLPCTKFESYRCGNVRNESIASIWQGPAMDQIRQLSACTVAQSGACASCRYNVICSGGCRAEALNAFGDLKAPDPACAILADSSVHRLSANCRPPGDPLVQLGNRCLISEPLRDRAVDTLRDASVG